MQTSPDPYRQHAPGRSSTQTIALSLGEIVIDVKLYFQISDMFRFRYDPALLGLIGERPHRFRELVSRLEPHVNGGHVDDNAVDRSLKRLARVKQIHKTHTRVGRRNVPIYTITDAGQLYLRVYHAFIDAYRGIQQETEGSGTGKNVVP